MLACVYDDGGRMTSTEYIQSLEKKVGELEALLGRPPAPSRSMSRTQDEEPSPSPSVKEQPADDLIETIVDATKNGGRSSPRDLKARTSVRHDLNPHDLEAQADSVDRGSERERSPSCIPCCSACRLILGDG